MVCNASSAHCRSPTAVPLACLHPTTRDQHPFRHAPTTSTTLAPPQLVTNAGRAQNAHKPPPRSLCNPSSKPLQSSIILSTTTGRRYFFGHKLRSSHPSKLPAKASIAKNGNRVVLRRRWRMKGENEERAKEKGN
ncbi:hypothetical protein RYX36_036424 [Vicia faba]